MDDETLFAKRRVALLPKNSPLLRGASWAPFLEEMRAICQTKDYRKKTIIDLLRRIDPSISSSFSLFYRLYGAVVGPGFPSGRKALYFDLLLQFVTKYRMLFNGAPKVVIVTFNELMKQLFPNIQDHTLLLLDVNLAYRKLTPEERMIQQGNKSRENIVGWLSGGVEHLFPTGALVLDEAERHGDTKKEFDIVPEEKEALFSRFLSGPALHFFSSYPQYKESVQFFLSGYLGELQKLLQYMDDAIVKQFQDFYDSIPHYSQISFPESFFESEPNLETILQYLNGYQEDLKRYVFLLNDRRKKISQIESEKKELLEKLQKYALNIHVQEIAKKYIDRIQEMPFPSTLEQLEEVSLDWKKLSYEIYNSFSSLFLQEEQFHIETLFRTLLFLMKKWNILKGSMGSLDLNNKTEKISSEILQTLFHDYLKISQGSISRDQYKKSLSLLCYDPDILLLREERYQRERRRLDLHQAILFEIQILDRYFLFMKFIEPSYQQNPALQHVIKARSYYYEKYLSWCASSLIFSETESPESVNEVFRLWWIEVELWQVHRSEYIETILIALCQYVHRDGLNKFFDKIFHPLLRTATRIEEILVKSGKTISWNRDIEHKQAPVVGQERAVVDPASRTAHAERFSSSSPYIKVLECREEISHLVGDDSLVLSDEMKQIIDLIWKKVDGAAEKIDPLFHFLFLLAGIEDLDEALSYGTRLEAILSEKERLFLFGKAIQAATTDDIEHIDVLFELFYDIDTLLVPDQTLSDSSLADVEERLKKLDDDLILHLAALDEEAVISKKEQLLQLRPSETETFLWWPFSLSYRKQAVALFYSNISKSSNNFSFLDAIWELLYQELQLIEELIQNRCVVPTFQKIVQKAKSITEIFIKIYLDKSISQESLQLASERALLLLDEIKKESLTLDNQLTDSALIVNKVGQYFESMRNILHGISQFISV